jgi:hypothetical protein
MDRIKLNQITLTILAPLMLLVGVGGFVIPSQYNLLSGSAPYNLFHIFLGAIGIMLLSWRNYLLVCSFNLALGVIDLYQVLASVVGLTPIQYFLWTPLDDFLHVILGFGLLILGYQGLRQWQERERS